MAIDEDETDEPEELDGYGLVERWQDQNHAHSFEGDSGLDRLEKLVEAIGYKGHGFRHGSPIENFLSDNPGAVEKIVDFIGEFVDQNDDWREALEEETGFNVAGDDDEEE